MTYENITPERYARASFLVDRKEGEYCRAMTWDKLSKQDKKLYIDEAKAYLKLPQNEWIDFRFYGVTL